MNCPKCKKDTCVLVTTEAKTKTKDYKGLLLWIFLFPFMLIRWFWRYLIRGSRKTKFHKSQHWHCNYCNHDFPQKFEE